jgi:hypothetical protein
MSAERRAAFVRSAVGVGPVDQSMYTDEELRSYVLAEANYFSVNRVTEHAGAFVPPVFERGLLPTPGSLPRLLGGPLPRWVINRAIPRLRYHCAGFDRIAAELSVEDVPSLPALLLSDLTLVPDIPLPERVALFLDPPGPVIYVALTSTGPELIREVIGALAEAIIELVTAPSPIQGR